MRFFLVSLLFFLGVNCENYAYGDHYVFRDDESFHVDKFDFSGKFPELEVMEIRAERKKRVHFDASGEFPELETITYKGSFGYLKAKVTGNYPKLSSMTIDCTSCKMDIDCRGIWSRSAHIFIHNISEPINIILPKDVGVVVHTKVSTGGKVAVQGDLIKKGRGIWAKTYLNSLANTSAIVLTFEVNSDAGGIITLC
ncbi:putative lipoprotein [Chlamydia ibidis]|uniref:Lipoprotein n=2 Tax=Chlamydia ibidis TaxID=1405396 RepID=A0ABN0N035_9CHLA|nr:hypothetical protein [Chlamydia ibidis]EPP35339.1 putative lipoprotein [Chlamydia ibidis]EQM62880.1 putative lipoprotein [Chlamydia ibidis 10-1398/6]